MKYEINPKKMFNLTAIPFEIKEYINEFNGDYLKILFLIFSENKQLTAFEIATKLDINVSLVDDAIKYWKFKGILSFPKEEKAVFEIEKPSAEHITTKELTQAKQENEVVDMLLSEAQALYKRPLKPIETRTMLYIFEYYSLPVDVILMVVDFCIRCNRSLKKIVSMCENMHDNGITSHKQAEQYIKDSTKRYNIEKHIKNCFGIHNRMLSLNEKKYIYKWAFEYKFEINIIKIAYNKCVDSTGTMSFPYIEKILQNWKELGVKVPSDIEKLSKKKTKNNSKKTSYNIKELLAANPLYIPQ